MSEKNKYNVRFFQVWDYYDIEAEDEYEAEEIAEKEFRSDMYRNVAHTDYDDVEVVECEEEFRDYYCR